jgi:hypothetical protein
MDAVFSPNIFNWNLVEFADMEATEPPSAFMKHTYEMNVLIIQTWNISRRDILNLSKFDNKKANTMLK